VRNLSVCDGNVTDSRLNAAIAALVFGVVSTLLVMVASRAGVPFRFLFTIPVATAWMVYGAFAATIGQDPDVKVPVTVTILAPFAFFAWNKLRLRLRDLAENEWHAPDKNINHAADK
jgi:hypothetical protein